MAGSHGHGGFEPVKIDPAIERWNLMRENVYQHFRFTPKTARQVLFWGAIIPLGMGYVAWKTDAKQDWAGKLRGQSLMVGGPAVSASAVGAGEEED